MRLVTKVLKENFGNEEMCLDASIIFRSIAKISQKTEEAMTVYTGIGFEFIFQILERYTENEKICESLLGMFDKKLNSHLKK